MPLPCKVLQMNSEIQILFLDTETSGLKAGSDQIIEIGAVVASFDFVKLKLNSLSTFQELVKLRQPLDSKITRITGITEEDLASASPLFIVQENWLSWLEKFPKVELIVGHSLDFDLGFLAAENWFLPEGYKVLDTLNLCRILYPNSVAVNLEHLVEFFKLLPDTKLQHHRSLFDSQACLKLLEKIFKSLDSLPIKPEIIKLFSKLYNLPQVEFFKEESTYTKSENITSNSKNSKSFSKLEVKSAEVQLENNPSNSQINTLLNSSDNDQNSTPKSETQIFTEITLTGEVKDLSFENSLKQISLEYLEGQLLASLEIPEKLTEILLQIYLAKIYQNLNPELKLKLHLRFGQTDAWITGFVLQVLSEASKKAETTAQNLNLVSENSYLLPRIERVLWEVRNVVEKKFEVTKFVELLDFLRLIVEPANQESLNLKLKKLIAALDFLALEVQSQAYNGRLEYSPFNSKLNLAVKIDEIIRLWQDLQINSEAPTSDSLYSQLQVKLQEKLLQMWQDCPLVSSLNWNFYYFRNALVASKNLPKPSLKAHFLQLKEKFPGLKFGSFLPENLVADFLTLAGLEDLSIATEVAISPKMELYENEDLQDFLAEKLETAKTSGKPIILLGGLNSSLNEVEKVLLQQFASGDFLILGESGSLTKIGSKLTRNFVGLVLTKVSSADFLVHLKRNNPQFNLQEVVIIHQPYLYVHPYWYAKSKETHNPEKYLENLKKLYLTATIGFLQAGLNCPISFLRSYR